MKYLQEIHKKYHKLIDEQVGLPIASALAQLKSLWIPSPEAYSGSEDIEVTTRFIAPLWPALCIPVQHLHQKPLHGWFCQSGHLVGCQ
jgi:hypothetical protein